MAGKRSLNLTGESGKVYDLDELANSNTRTDSSKALKIEVLTQDPKNPEVGRIWLKVKPEENIK